MRIPVFVICIIGLMSCVRATETTTVTTPEYTTFGTTTEKSKTNKPIYEAPSSYVSRWNYGVGFQAERMIFPQLTDYHILMVIDIPQIFKNVRREQHDKCDVQQDGKCVVRNACSHILLPPTNATKIDPRKTKLTCAYINLVLARLKRTSMEISKDLFSTVTDPFQAVSDDNLEQEHSERVKRNVIDAIQALSDATGRHNTTQAQRTIYDSIIGQVNQHMDNEDGIQRHYNMSAPDFLAKFQSILQETVLQMNEVQAIVSELQDTYDQECTEEALLQLDMTDPLNQHICHQASMVSQAVLNITSGIKQYYNEMLRDTISYLDKRSDRVPPRHRTVRNAGRQATKLKEESVEQMLILQTLDQLTAQLTLDTQSFHSMEKQHNQILQEMPYIQKGARTDSHTHEKVNSTSNISKRAIPAVMVAGAVGIAAGATAATYLHGCASEEMIEEMEEVVKMLGDKQAHQQTDIDHLKNRLTHLKTSVLSVIRLQTETIDTLETMIHSVNSRLYTATTALHEKVQANSRFVTYSVLALTNLMHEMHAMSNQAHRYLTAIRALRQGQLTPELVDEDNLNSILKQLSRHLQKKYPSLQIAEKNVHAHYGRKELKFWRTEEQFIVAIPIALSPSEVAFRTYKVKIFNLPISDDSVYTTRLREENDIFGISEDGTKFLEASSQDLMHCRQGRTLRCAEATKLYDSYYPTCLAAIFLDNKEQIKRLCHFQFEKVPIKTEINLLADDKALVQNAESVIYSCSNEPAISRPGCKMCAVDLMCGCSTTVTSLNWGTVSIGPRITDCQEQDMQYLVFKPTNLAAMQYLETKRHLWYLAADYMRPGTEPGEQMDIDVDNTTYNIAMNRKYELSMDLKKAMKEAQRKIPVRTVYRNPLASWNIYSAKDLLDMPVLLSMISFVISTLTFLWTCYACCRSRTSSAAFMSGMMRGVRAQPTDILDQLSTQLPATDSQTTPLTFVVNPSVPCQQSYHWYWLLLVVTLLIIIIVYMVVSVIYAYRKRKQRGICEILLGIQVERRLEWIHVMDLVLPTRYIDLHMPTAPTNLNLEGSGVNPTLTVEWNEVQLLIDNEDTITVFPQRLPLTFMQYIKLRYMLNEPHHLHMKYIYHYSRMTVEQSFEMM